MHAAVQDHGQLAGDREEEGNEAVQRKARGILHFSICNLHSLIGTKGLRWLRRIRNKNRSACPNVGRVTQIIGSTFDAEFPEDQLPPIYNAVPHRRRAQGHQASTSPARCSSTLAAAASAASPWAAPTAWSAAWTASTPAPRSSVPVGKATLGRVFNLLGEPIDERGPVNAEEHWPIHRDAPPVDRPLHQDGNLRDRHQGHRPADALRPRRQGRTVRRGRPGQDGHPHRN